MAALRLLLDALKKEAKQARGELDEQGEIAVLKRERKRRAEAAEAYRKGGRDDAAAAEEAEAELIDAYLPAQISDEELRAAGRRRARARPAPQSPEGDGQGDVGRDVEGRRARRRPPRQRAGQGAGWPGRPRRLRTQLTLDPAVATELAGSEDAVLKALEGHLDARRVPARQRAHARRRPRATSRSGREVVAGAVGADRAGPPDLARHDRRRDVRARPAREPLHDPRRRRLDPPLDARRAEDREPEALRRLDPRQHDHVRDRAGRHRARPTSRWRWRPPRCRAAT